MLREVALAAACSALACTPARPAPENAEAAAPTGSSAPAPSGAAASPAAAAPAVERWSGTYSSTAGSLYVFDGGEWSSVTWRGDEAGVGLGEGSLSLQIDPATGSVRGVVGGALGDAIVTGAETSGTITASILRKDAQDRGLTGTAIGKVAGDALTGTMRLSAANARVLREASFKLAREKP